MIKTCVRPETVGLLIDIRESAGLDEERVPSELDSDNPENMSTQNRTLDLVEFDINSDSEKPYFSKTLGKYLAISRQSNALRSKTQNHSPE